MHCVNRNHHSTVWALGALWLCSRRPRLARRGAGGTAVPRRGLWRGAHRGRANVDHDVDQMCMPICTLGLNLRFDLCLPWRHCACARTGLDPHAVVFVRHLRSSRMLRSTTRCRWAPWSWCPVLYASQYECTTRRCRWAPWSWCLVLASRAVERCC